MCREEVVYQQIKRQHLPSPNRRSLFNWPCRQWGRLYNSESSEKKCKWQRTFSTREIKLFIQPCNFKPIPNDRHNSPSQVMNYIILYYIYTRYVHRASLENRIFQSLHFVSIGFSYGLMLYCPFCRHRHLNRTQCNIITVWIRGCMTCATHMDKVSCLRVLRYYLF